MAIRKRLKRKLAKTGAWEFLERCFDKSKRNAYRKDKEKCIKAAMDLAGWTRKEAVRQIADTRKRLGVSYKEYRKLKLAGLDPEEQKEKINEKKEKEAALKKERAEMTAEIMARNGWTKEQTTSEIRRLREELGCSVAEIWSYKLEQMSEEEQKTIFFKSQQRIIMKNYPRSKGLGVILNNKEESNRFFAKYIRRRWCANTEMDLDSFCETFKDCDSVIYKPSFGNQARGIEAIPLKDRDMKEVYETLKSYPRGVIEERIIQHPKMAQLNPTSVNCLRVMTVSSETSFVGEEGRHADIMCISVKTGGAGAIMDNLHAGGGVIFGVDLKSGIADSDGVDWYGNVYKEHPVTGTPIRGFELPLFEETKEFMYEIIRDLHLEGVIGWDIAITEDGPVVVEANSNPAPRLMGLPYCVEKKGILPAMLKYIYPEDL